MCGITGIFSKTPVDGAIIKAMTLSLAHRGPDASGIHQNAAGTIALGHTRLSIIDLSASANQPFYSADGRYVMVFNGEIYNFQQIKNELVQARGTAFRTHSDTEVILEGFIAWGAKIVNKLQGMFTIAIVDHAETKLFLFRDRLGKKPLYFFNSRSLFAFASEIKSLLKHPEIASPASLNKRVVGTFLHLGYIPEPETIYSTISKFPSGHFGVVNADLNLDLDSYWRVDDHLVHRETQNLPAARARFNELLDDAVQKRLISDVPLGSFLSGGTDSSLVTAIASRHVPSPLKTFSIGFKESKFDESAFARRVAACLKTDHTEYILAEKEAVDLLDVYLRHFDEPFADTSAIPTMLVAKLAREKVKVVLTGDGGDELFQGYGAYAWADRLAGGPWKWFRHPLHTLLRISGNSRLQRVSHLLDTPAAGNLRSHIFSQEQYFFEQREVRDLLFRKSEDFAPFEYDERFLSALNLSEGEKQAVFDLKYYLKDDLLVKVDRASMYHGLECRCPLLDYRVVEFALALDRGLKIKNGITKWLLKDCLKEYLPAELVNRPKWGFSVPLASWLRNDLRYLIDHYLSDIVIGETGIFNTGYVNQLKKDFFDGKDYLYNRLWVLIVFHKWMKESRS